MPRTRSIAWSELKVGMLGVVAIALAAALILAVGGQGGFFWQRYPLKVRFEDVEGLKAGAIVRLNGMEVGKVTDVSFAGAEVEVVMEVSRSVRPLITSHSEAAMGTLSLLGEPIVVIRAAATGTPLPDGAYVPSGRVGGIAALASSTSRGMDEAAHLLAELRRGEGSLGRLLTDDSLYHATERLVSAATRVAEQLEAGQGTLGALATDRSAYLALQGALENLRGIGARIDGGEGALGRLITDDALGRSLAGTSANMERITGQLASGEGTAGKLLSDRELYDRLTRLTTGVDRLVAELESGKGTAGRLLSDQQLYENVNQAATELRGLLADIRRDPKKYLNVSFSVF
jgi:phospholipid/cholesterol/gamma-HCH transport system substrate-binding protein